MRKLIAALILIILTPLPVLAEPHFPTPPYFGFGDVQCLARDQDGSRGDGGQPATACALWFSRPRFGKIHKATKIVGLCSHGVDTTDAFANFARLYTPQRPGNPTADPTDRWRVCAAACPQAIASCEAQVQILDKSLQNFGGPCTGGCFINIPAGTPPGATASLPLLRSIDGRFVEVPFDDEDDEDAGP